MEKSNNPVAANQSGKRIVYYDLLRVLCVFGVMVLHVAASNLKIAPVESFAWHTFNVFDSVTRVCVPVFIMISGSLFLDPERKITLEKLFKKNIMRIVTAFFFWSAYYILFERLVMKIAGNEVSFAGWVGELFKGRYHLWFMYAIFGLYLITPLLRKFTADKKLTEYFLLLSAICSCIIPALKNIKPISPALNSITTSLNMNFVYGYVGYFVLGYYLKSTEITPKIRKLIYFLGGFGTLATIIGTALWSAHEGKATVNLYNNFMPNVCMGAVAVFVFFKYEVSKIKWSERQIKVISRLSGLSFGMYLFHDSVNIVFKDTGFTTLSYNPILAVICNSLIAFAVSLAVTLVLSKIPKINKYIM